MEKIPKLNLAHVFGLLAWSCRGAWPIDPGVLHYLGEGGGGPIIFVPGFENILIETDTLDKGIS